jgi:hypothetical protein
VREEEYSMSPFFSQASGADGVMFVVEKEPSVFCFCVSLLQVHMPFEEAGLSVPQATSNGRINRIRFMK